jgi:hypothetical protein
MLSVGLLSGGYGEDELVRAGVSVEQGAPPPGGRGHVATSWGREPI